MTVILPWGNLLRAVAAPDMPSLLQVASLCSLGASLEVVLSYDPERDGQEGARLGLSRLTDTHVKSALPKLYEQAGLRIVSAVELPQPELTKYETTWAKRLAIGRSRRVWRIQARNDLP